tara:strand:- start:5672 stop:6145 length:474 start_codon:yes stop_codon:yes gene_type:complete
MSDEIRVEITQSIDLSDIKARLDGAVLRVFEEQGLEMKKAIQQQWRGWKYKGRDMRTIGQSLKGWGYEIQATEGVRELLIFNKAKGWASGKSYSAYVARSKGAEEEWKVMRDMLTRDRLPKMITAVTKELAKGMRRGPTKKVRENKQSKSAKMTIQF